MNALPSDAPPPADESAKPHKARFEALLASGLLAFGLFVLPGVVYAVGVALLGPYGEGRGLGSFYGDYFRDLAEPTARTWAMALGPLAIVYMLRLVWAGRRAAEGADEQTASAPHKPKAERASEHQRRLEPHVGED